VFCNAEIYAVMLREGELGGVLRFASTCAHSHVAIIFFASGLVCVRARVGG
jgi:hypothetical protein